MIKRFIIALIIVAVFVGGLAYFQLVFKPQMIKQFLSSQAPPPATITAEAAKTEEWVERLPAIGTLIASQGVEVASQVPGIVTAIGFESGQDVPVGTKLVQLDIAVEQADLASSQAVLREADVAFKRQTDLMTKAVTSEANVDTARAKRDTADAAVKRIEAVIAQKGITAPCAAVRASWAFYRKVEGPSAETLSRPQRAFPAHGATQFCECQWRGSDGAQSALSRRFVKRALPSPVPMVSTPQRS
jgi:multidrug efflux pump subunit AcrA (membrane-fusion protein)